MPLEHVYPEAHATVTPFVDAVAIGIGTRFDGILPGCPGTHSPSVQSSRLHHRSQRAGHTGHAHIIIATAPVHRRTGVSTTGCKG